MSKRHLRIVEQTQPTIGVCERCNSQFKGDSQAQVETAFGSHKCKPVDSSQNALRVVREATEEK